MLTTKTDASTNGLKTSPTQLEPIQAQDDPGDQGEEQDRRRGEHRGRASARRHTGGRGRGRAGTGTPPRRATGPAAAPPAGSASRVGYSDSPDAASPGRPWPPARRHRPSPEMHVPTRHLEARSRRPGARAARAVARAPDLRPAAGAERGRAALELPRRADHGQQPDGRPPRLGPRLQGPLPALPRDARRGPALPERVRLPGPVGRGQRRARPRLHDASATSRRTASTAS